jgi:CRP-like cAMP-binding protein
VLAGQLVGALAVINNKPRTANLSASRTEAILLAIDFAQFGALQDFSKIQLQTKICLYRAVVAFTFWKLDEYRYRHQDAFLTEKLAEYNEYTGEKNTIDELLSQANAIAYLGNLLEQWNRSR